MNPNPESNYSAPSNIVPDEIPANTVPLPEDFDRAAVEFRNGDVLVQPEDLEHLVGKNVHVNMSDGTSFTGLMQYKGHGDHFRVGLSYPISFPFVKSFREV